MAGRPAPDEYIPYFDRYISLVTEDHVLEVLDRQVAALRTFARGVGADREGHRYAPGKWSVRQVVGHLIDGERVFGYRAFCFSRRDTTNLPSFDENAYVANGDSDGIPLIDLAEEFAVVRVANLAVLRRLDEDGWRLTGTANQNRISVRALAYVMAGHVRHHMALFTSKYGLDGAA